MYCFNDNSKYFYININILLIWRAGHLLPVKRVWHFCWGVTFTEGNITWGVILINVMKVVQSSNEHDMKLNVTAKNSKHPL